MTRQLKMLSGAFLMDFEMKQYLPFNPWIFLAAYLGLGLVPSMLPKPINDIGIVFAALSAFGALAIQVIWSIDSVKSAINIIKRIDSDVYNNCVINLRPYKKTIALAFSAFVISACIKIAFLGSGTSSDILFMIIFLIGIGSTMRVFWILGSVLQDCENCIKKESGSSLLNFLLYLYIVIGAPVFFYKIKRMNKFSLK